MACPIAIATVIAIVTARGMRIAIVIVIAGAMAMAIATARATGIATVMTRPPRRRDYSPAHVTRQVIL